VLYAYLFLDDFVLLYSVYTLLFSDAGLSVWQISSLFVIWSLSSLVLEVPSGAWADATSRRSLLVAGPLLTAVAFGLWVAAPGYWVFALGFLLWGLKSALTSGALEALVYEELQRLEATDRYAMLMGRGQVAGVLAATCSGAVAAPVIAAGGFVAVGVASVAVCVLTSAVGMLFPENRIRAGDDSGSGWAATLAAGLREARESRSVRAAVLLVAVVASVWGALDEYTPLLIESSGVSVADVALLMVVVGAGAAMGGLLAGRAARLRSTALAVLIFGGAALMAAGALSMHPLGVLALAAAFGVFQLATVVADARLQESITGPARATVTSLAGMSTDVATLAVYGSYASLVDLGGHSGAFALLMLPYLGVAWWLRRRRLEPVRRGHAKTMSVTSFQDLPLADRDREWDGAAAEKRVRKWAGAEDEPNQKYRDAHVWYDGDNKDNFTAYKLLIADVIDGKLKAVPRGVMAAGGIMEGARGGVDLPKDDIDRVGSHLAKYYKKMGEDPPWERS
jgi:predicted MFS family arabinose efflux permease